MSILLAVHISDGVLQWPWLVGGFVLAAALGWLGSRRLEEGEIPRIAVMSAAFFVATLIHVPVPGLKAHLLLNGLVGIVLGARAVLAVPLALVLQALLLGHGGMGTLGVNTCVMLLPALSLWLVFAGLRRSRWVRTPRGRWLVGFFIGGLGVMLTAVLNSFVLWLGGLEDWPTLAVVVLVAHLPVAGVEALVMAATINFLAQVKPEMLGLQLPAAPPTPQEPSPAERQAG